MGQREACGYWSQGQGRGVAVDTAKERVGRVERFRLWDSGGLSPHQGQLCPCLPLPRAHHPEVSVSRGFWVASVALRGLPNQEPPLALCEMFLSEPSKAATPLCVWTETSPYQPQRWPC